MANMAKKISLIIFSAVIIIFIISILILPIYACKPQNVTITFNDIYIGGSINLSSTTGDSAGLVAVQSGKLTLSNVIINSGFTLYHADVPSSGSFNINVISNTSNVTAENVFYNSDKIANSDIGTTGTSSSADSYDIYTKYARYG